MDSFKKGSSKINIPIAIRFNAHEDSVEDVTPQELPPNTSSSLPTSSSSALGTEPLSSSVGTWKMIKGRVSQAMVDMKSSKHSDSSIASRKLNLNEVSGDENEFSDCEDDSPKKLPDTDKDQLKEKENSKKSFYSKLTSPSVAFEKCKKAKKTKSEKELSDKDNEKKDKIGSEDNDISENVLRRRHLDSQQQASELSDPDIESGVEITEEMTLSCYGVDTETIPSDNDTSNVRSYGHTKRKPSITDSSKLMKYLKLKWIKLKKIHENICLLLKSYTLTISFIFIYSAVFLSSGTSTFLQGFFFAWLLLCTAIETIAVFRKRLGPLPRENGYYYASAADDNNQVSSELPCSHKLRNIRRSPSTQSNIHRSYSDNDIFEHKHVLSYTGWMNEISKYDPVNYHSSMTKTVAIRLDGSILRISSCAKGIPNKERVPRRAMWNEPFYNNQSLLDDENSIATKKRVKNKHWKHVNMALYSKHRHFELLNCIVELLPRGLARKRHFSKKYPIQLTIREAIETVEHIVQLNPQPESKTETEDTDAIDVEDVKEVEKATIDFLEEERLAIKREFTTDQLIEEVKKTTKFSKAKTLILFARCDREKEDWYRRFSAASAGKVYVTANSNIINPVSPWGEINAGNEFPDLVMVNSAEVNKAKVTPTKKAIRKKASKKDRQKKKEKKEGSKSSDEDWKWAFSSDSDSSDSSSEKLEMNTIDAKPKNFAMGLIMSACASQGPEDHIKPYLQFMSVYQHFSKLTIDEQLYVQDSTAQVNNMSSTIKSYFLSPKKTYYSAETEEPLPIPTEKFDAPPAPDISTKPNDDLREQRSADILWINVFLGRIIYSFLMNQQFSAWIHNTLQRKLDIIKLPVFMENICIKNINLGDTAPIFKNSKPPVCDERGLWFESDCSYRGLVHMTMSVQLNLMRLKRVEQHKSKVESEKSDSTSDETDSEEIVRNEIKEGETNNKPESDNKQTTITKPQKLEKKDKFVNNARHKLRKVASICDSDAESIVSSDSETDSLSQNGSDNESSDDEKTEKKGEEKNKGGGKSKKIMRMFDRITASNFFQSATEYSYVQKAMKNMSKNIRLCVELKGVEGRMVFNIPPPPTDRLWISFRTPPKLLISATPVVGETTFDWDIVTSTIENKLYEEILKMLVYPNMIDLIIPVLGEPTYTEPEEMIV